MRADLPTGTVTFLFTDIEGSTRLLQEIGDRYADVLQIHHQTLRDVWATHGGVEVDTAGDGFFVVFGRATDAVAAAQMAQEALAGGRVRVRMGMHTGEPLLTATGYVGMDVHRAARIASVAHGGQVLLSEATAGHAAGAPVRDLGRHRLKDLRHPERLFQLGEVDFPPLRSLYSTNLPAQPNPLVGRGQEVARLSELVRGGARLLTLTGPGGTGKTRIALATAAALASEFPDGVWFVPLAAVGDPALVEQTIAQALGLRGELREELRPRQMLIVLDNFEQLLAAAPIVAELLAEAPGVSTIVTTRERFALAAEREFPVSPLPLAEAVALFAARASALLPSFTVDEDVEEIVRRLDGLPLALELAAARVSVLSPAAILQRLDESLNLLSGRVRDAPARHRTLRATIEWSYALLTSGEAGVFDRLGVFAGSFDLSAAESVAAASLDDLAGLIDKSMLRRSDTGSFFMLETIRQFAVERLRLADTADDVQARHAAYYVALAERWDPATRDARQSDAVREFRRHQPDLRVALDTLAVSQDPLPGARLAGSLTYFWYLTGQYREATQRLQAARRNLKSRDVAERASVANGLALMSAMSNDQAAAMTFAVEALEIGRRHDDVQAQLRALTGIAAACSASGDLEGARRTAEEQISLARRSRDLWYEALGTVNLAVALRESGEVDASYGRAVEALRLAHETGDPTLEIGCAANVAHAELRLENFAVARARFLEALALLRHDPLPEMVIWCLDGLAAVDARSGNAEGAARIFGAAEALAASTFYGHPGTEIEFAATRAALDERLGSERAAALRAVGSSLDLDAAFELALGAS